MNWSCIWTKNYAHLQFLLLFLLTNSLFLYLKNSSISTELVVIVAQLADCSSWLPTRRRINLSAWVIILIMKLEKRKSHETSLYWWRIRLKPII